MRSKALAWITALTLAFSSSALAQQAGPGPAGSQPEGPAAAASSTGDAEPLVPAPSVDEPRSGKGRIIAGSILTGFAALNLATLPIVYTDFYHDLVRDGYGLSDSEADDTVKVIGYVTIGQIVVEAAIGIPLLVSGLNARKHHRAWKARQESAFVPAISYSLKRQGTRDYHVLSLGMTF